MQAVSEHECGLAAMSTDGDLQQLLARLMDCKIRLLLRGRAAVLLASLELGSIDLFTEVSSLHQGFTLCRPWTEEMADLWTVSPLVRGLYAR